MRNTRRLLGSLLVLGLVSWGAVSFPRVQGPTADLVLQTLRIPRVLLAMAVGAGLSLSGAVLQALFRNPLASPLTLGVAGGAAFGGILAMVFGIQVTLPGLPFFFGFALLFALLTLFLTYRLALHEGRLRIAVLLLAGVVLNFFYSGLILLTQYLSDYTRTFETVRWLMGNLSIVGLSIPLTVLGVVGLVGLGLFFFSPVLNLLSQGTEAAHALGVAVNKTVTALFVLVSLLVGVSVALTGPIGFVGLVVPHAVRQWVGADHRTLLPMSALWGAIALVVADWIGRVLLMPQELPVGVVTGLLGSPYFLWLLYRSDREGWG